MWVRLDDRFAQHPKVVGLTDSAFRLHICALVYAAGHLTDGYLPGKAIRAMPKGHVRQTRELVNAGLWEETSGGWVIHDFLSYNPPRAKVEAEREAGAERAQRSRERSANRVVPFARTSRDPSRPPLNSLVTSSTGNPEIAENDKGQEEQEERASAGQVRDALSTARANLAEKHPRKAQR